MSSRRLLKLVAALVVGAGVGTVLGYHYGYADGYDDLLDSSYMPVDPQAETDSANSEDPPFD